MHPYITENLSSYSFMLVLAVFAAVGLFRVLGGKTPAAVYRYYSLAAIVAIAVGLGSAFLFQAIYDFAETGVFELSGLTFMGGLAGGVVTFVLFGALAPRPEIRGAFFAEAEKAVPCIAIAHGIGRIGCFLAGCCYGRESAYGLYFPELGRRVIPTQLYEAIFLFALFGAILTLEIRNQRSGETRRPLATEGISLIVYCFAYSIFRFVLEFFRDDPRGAFLGALSPSQVMSIILFAAGCALTLLRIRRPGLFVLPEKFRAAADDGNNGEAGQADEAKETSDSQERGE